MDYSEPVVDEWVVKVRGSENPAGGMIPDSWGGVHHHDAVTYNEAKIIID